jgi:hypothetical protein
MQQARYNQLHNHANKQKKPVLAPHDTSNNGPELTADTNPAHRLTAENNDKSEHKVSPPASAPTVDTSFVDPVLTKILKQLKG